MIREFPTRRCAAFTLIEIMVVCAIIGIVLTMGIPSIYRKLHPESMQMALTKIKYLCEVARGQAVLNGTTMKVVIRQTDRIIEVQTGATRASPANPLAGYDLQPNRLESKNLAGEEWRMEERNERKSRPAWTPSDDTRFKLPDSIRIEGMRLHLKDFSDDEVVEVSFYANGTCDEFALFLVSNDNERREISLEVSTALVDVNVDPLKFR
ncbi:MAG TPA: prepilin-type N-terminal cleavage/methylation domain-containing protein [Candidatus Binatia bacterium]|nr:prepilin-type N-terminal cleavage/methylation domain-containing protein [Candidatus Binatia bacterium]